MKKLKLILVFALIGAFLLGLSASSFALPINVDMVDNYFYDQNRNAVAAPVAYRPIDVLGLSSWKLDKSFNPVDSFVYGEYLYIVDKGGSQILVVDEEYNIVKKISEIKDSPNYTVPDLDKYIYTENGTREEDSKMARANKYALRNPEGIFITNEGVMYIADTENRRVVVCDLDGVCKKVYQSLRIDVLGVTFVFKPEKIVVDKSETMSVIAYGVNKGLIQIDSDGVFQQFFGAPATSIQVTDWVYALFASAEDLASRVKNVAAEYASITADSKGFIYTVCSDTSTGAPSLQKLSADGSNVLTQEEARYAGYGDLQTSKESKGTVLIDAAVNEETNTYTILDATLGRFFTYDSSGRLLFVGGGAGNQYGRFKSPTSIVCRGDQIVITDAGNQTITVYETTDYAKKVCDAITQHKKGNYDVSAEDWNQVIQYYSNMYIAYESLGNIQVIKGRDVPDDQVEQKMEYYSKSLEYFKLAEYKKGYSESFKELRNQELSKYFTLIFISFCVIFVGIIVLIYVRKYRKSRAEE
ncbi:MAG: hypothetical protein DBX47_05575, partial [Clostridiales bacterium]